MGTTLLLVAAAIGFFAGIYAHKRSDPAWGFGLYASLVLVVLFKWLGNELLGSGHVERSTFFLVASPIFGCIVYVGARGFAQEVMEHDEKEIVRQTKPQVWRYMLKGKLKVIGPDTALIEMVESGQIGPETRVMQPGTGSWLLAKEAVASIRSEYAA